MIITDKQTVKKVFFIEFNPDLRAVIDIACGLVSGGEKFFSIHQLFPLLSDLKFRG